VEKEYYFDGGKIKIRKAGSTDFNGKHVEFADALVIEAGKDKGGFVASVKVGNSFVMKLLALSENEEFMRWIEGVKP